MLDSGGTLTLQGRRILLGVCGSIAAYKAPLLVRLLKKAGADVRVIMTRSAHQFVTQETLSTLSEQEVYTSFYKKKGIWTNHVSLGLWAEHFLIAPLSANTMSKMVQGQCDSLLLSVYLSARCGVSVAPAMDEDMYLHVSTKENMKCLASRGVSILPCGRGSLASGLEGEGRMQEPAELFRAMEGVFSSRRYKGKKVMITAGPTYEHFDKVRFLGNYSSGKMGIAIAEAFAREGAEVDLIFGPSHIGVSDTSVRVHSVSSADEMYVCAKKLHKRADISVFAAAVSDYKPKYCSDKKIKKDGKSLTVHLDPNIDIAKSLGGQKQKGQIHIGFALESCDGEQYANEKMVKKSFDMIVLNLLGDAGAGFLHDTNKVSFFFPFRRPLHFPLTSKRRVAENILNAIDTHVLSSNKERASVSS